MARLRERGGLYEVSCVVSLGDGTGLCAVRHGSSPAHGGMPGLRWFDRARSLRWSLAPARSYSASTSGTLDGDSESASSHALRTRGDRRSPA
jgi:hypothetical protein